MTHHHNSRIALLLLAIVAIVAGLAYRPAAIRVAAILDARRNSEGAAFRHALKAMRQGERRDALRATMHWLDRLDDEPPPARLDRFLERHGESQDRAIAAMLGEFDSPLTADDRRAMATSLRRARTRCLQVRRRKSAAGVLPELNPTRH